MFYFSTLRFLFKAREKIYIDNLFIFYFIREIEKKLKENICLYSEKVCEKCPIKNSCIFPKIFLMERWSGQPNLMVVSSNYLNEYLKKDKILELDFILIDEATNIFPLLKEVIKESLKETNFRNLFYLETYYYNTFAEVIEKIEDISTLPRYNIKEFLELRSGLKKIKIKIYPSFLSYSEKLENLNKEKIKRFLLREIFKRANELLEENINLSENYSINIVESSLKEIDYRDIFLRKVISSFKNHKFFEGEVILEGELSNIWNILEIIQTFGIGKLTVYGFGKVKLIKI